MIHLKGYSREWHYEYIVLYTIMIRQLLSTKFSLNLSQSSFAITKRLPAKKKKALFFLVLHGKSRLQPPTKVMRSCDKSCARHTFAYNWLAISTKKSSRLVLLCIHFFLHLNIFLARTFTGQKLLPDRTFCTLILLIKAGMDLFDNGA